jgi:hypothetical protein
MRVPVWLHFGQCFACGITMLIVSFTVRVPVWPHSSQCFACGIAMLIVTLGVVKHLLCAAVFPPMVYVWHANANSNYWRSDA